MKDQYIPIEPVFYDMFYNEIDKAEHSRIHHFTSLKELAETRGMVEKIISDSDNNEFLVIKSGEKIRLDRIIALNGKPGPAYDEYDSYANACLDCMGGMED